MFLLDGFIDICDETLEEFPRFSAEGDALLGGQPFAVLLEVLPHVNID